MAHKKSHRKNHSRSHKKKKNSKNIINKTIDKTIDTTVAVADKTVSFTKTTSKKYMPKVKSGLENVGSKVITTGTKSVPFLQRMTRKFFGMITGNKTKKNRKH